MYLHVSLKKLKKNHAVNIKYFNGAGQGRSVLKPIVYRYLLVLSVLMNRSSSVSKKITFPLLNSKFEKYFTMFFFCYNFKRSIPFTENICNINRGELHFYRVHGKTLKKQKQYSRESVNFIHQHLKLKDRLIFKGRNLELEFDNYEQYLYKCYVYL